uniref:Uncharacterized protein n=1 Tax=Anguilla anguilla TaxID=7936 RepID=A0A0E9WLN6_ANGAN
MDKNCVGLEKSEQILKLYSEKLKAQMCIAGRLNLDLSSMACILYPILCAQQWGRKNGVFFCTSKFYSRTIKKTKNNPPLVGGTHTYNLRLVPSQTYQKMLVLIDSMTVLLTLLF